VSGERVEVIVEPDRRHAATIPAARGMSLGHRSMPATVRTRADVASPASPERRSPLRFRSVSNQRSTTSTIGADGAGSVIPG
jgi:hypothetical protein